MAPKYTEQKLHDIVDARADSYLNDEEKRKQLSHGITSVAKDGKTNLAETVPALRDTYGVKDFVEMVRQSAHNTLNNSHGQEYVQRALNSGPLTSMYQTVHSKLSSSGFDDTALAEQHAINLSNSNAIVGMDNTEGIFNVSTIDVTLRTLMTSLVSYFCIERPMLTLEQNITYINAVDTEDNSRIYKGNFQPFNSDLEGIDSDIVGLFTTNIETPFTDSPTISADFSASVVPTETTFSVVDTANNDQVLITARDDGNGGFITSINTIGIDSSSINYVTGTISLNVPNYSSSMKLVANGKLSRDGISGGQVTDFTSKMERTFLSAERMEINYTDDDVKLKNFYNIMNQPVSNGNQAIDVVSMMSNIAIDSIQNQINKNIIRNLYLAATTNGVPQEITDITQYDVQSFAQTKDDLISRFLLNLINQYTERTDMNPTAILVGYGAASILATMNSQHYVASYGATSSASKGDMVVGTFAGVTIIRHRSMDQIGKMIDINNINNGTTSSGQSTDPNDYVSFPFLVGTRTPDNQAASLAFGSYLDMISFYSRNWNNPSQNKTQFITYNAQTIIEKSLTQMGILQVDKFVATGGVSTRSASRNTNSAESKDVTNSLKDLAKSVESTAKSVENAAKIVEVAAQTVDATKKK